MKTYEKWQVTWSHLFWHFWQHSNTFRHIHYDPHFQEKQHGNVKNPFGQSYPKKENDKQLPVILLLNLSKSKSYYDWKNLSKNVIFQNWSNFVKPIEIILKLSKIFWFKSVYMIKKCLFLFWFIFNPKHLDCVNRFKHVSSDSMTNRIFGKNLSKYPRPWQKQGLEISKG